MIEELIESAADLARAAESFRKQPELALDTEGDGFFRYTARLCTVQLATPTRICVVDTLALDPAPLVSLFEAEQPRKIIHDAAFDVRLLAQRGTSLRSVFDTAVAARFLGEAQTGLASLVSKYLGVELEKKHQRTDWGQRPLSEQLLKYLRDDVRHLIPLAACLEHMCRQRDIASEVEEECRYVLGSTVEEAVPARAWSRIKGAHELEPLQRARLRELVSVRDKTARERDVPPFRVLPDPALRALARVGPRNRRALRRLLRRPVDAELAEALLEAVERGAGALPALEADERLAASRLVSKEQRTRRRQCVEALTVWRKQQAEERAVDAQAVLPGHCLRDLVRLQPRTTEELVRIDGLGRVRIERYGDSLLRLLQGVRG